jgi:hypothetical protein
MSNGSPTAYLLWAILSCIVCLTIYLCMIETPEDDLSLSVTVFGVFVLSSLELWQVPVLEMGFGTAARRFQKGHDVWISFYYSYWWSNGFNPGTRTFFQSLYSWCSAWRWRRSSIMKVHTIWIKGLGLSLTFMKGFVVTPLRQSACVIPCLKVLTYSSGSWYLPVIPRPFDYWDKSNKRWLLPLYFVLSFGWALELCVQSPSLFPSSMLILSCLWCSVTHLEGLISPS